METLQKLTAADRMHVNAGWRPATYFLNLPFVSHVLSQSAQHQEMLTRFGCQSSGPETVFSMHHQNSCSVSPFQAYTGHLASASAAAISFYKIKMTL